MTGAIHLSEEADVLLAKFDEDGNPADLDGATKLYLVSFRQDPCLVNNYTGLANVENRKARLETNKKPISGQLTVTLMKNRRPSEQLMQMDEKRAYLSRLRQLFPISRIYYPGCGNDVILEGPFKPEEIVYLDEDGEDIPKKWRRPPYNFVLGDYGRHRFEDNFFDAIFYQDNHANREETRTIRRTLRPEGIIIHSSFDCSYPTCLEVEQFSRMRGIVEVHLPFCNEYYTAFQKLK